MSKNYKYIFIFILTTRLIVSYGQFAGALPSVGKNSFHCIYEGYMEPTMFDKNAKGFYDLSFLKSPWSITETYQKANAGKYAKLFPKATMVHLKTNNEEEYLMIKNGGLYSLGKVVDVQSTRGKQMVVRYLPSKRIFQTGSKKGSKYNNNYTQEIRFSKLDFVTPLFTEDSIKIVAIVNEQVTVIGEGPMLLPNFNHEVQKHESMMDSKVSVKVKKGKGQWTETNISPTAILPKELCPINAKFYQVKFLSDVVKNVVVMYDLFNDGVRNFSFQQNEISPLSINIDHEDSHVIAHPNPTFGAISFELFNYPFGNYKLEVYNVIGKKILSADFNAGDGRSLQADLSSLKKGTYLYSIFDGNGKKITTKRVSIIEI